MRCLGKERFTSFPRQRGFMLIEILAGLAILGLIGAGILSGFFTTFKGIVVSQESVAAESLAKSQIEYIKTQHYISVADYNPDDPANRYDLIDIDADLLAAGYSVNITRPRLVFSGNAGFELQSITLAVKRNDQGKLIIEIYRVNG